MPRSLVCLTTRYIAVCVATLVASLAFAVSCAWAQQSAHLPTTGLRQSISHSKLSAPSPLTSPAVPSYVVTTAADDRNGSPGNCTDQSQPGASRDTSCSLRDAFAAA
ncbi:MAG: hypothetical protein WBX22_32945, partial [Silvibacterium sp.]